MLGLMGKSDFLDEVAEDVFLTEEEGDADELGSAPEEVGASGGVVYKRLPSGKLVVE